MLSSNIDTFFSNIDTVSIHELRQFILFLKYDNALYPSLIKDYELFKTSYAECYPNAPNPINWEFIAETLDNKVDSDLEKILEPVMKHLSQAMKNARSQTDNRPEDAKANANATSTTLSDKHTRVFIDGIPPSAPSAPTTTSNSVSTQSSEEASSFEGGGQYPVASNLLTPVLCFGDTYPLTPLVEDENPTHPVTKKLFNEILPDTPNTAVQSHTPVAETHVEVTSSFWLLAIQSCFAIGGVCAVIALVTCPPVAAALGLTTILGVAVSDITVTAMYAVSAAALFATGLFAVMPTSDQSVVEAQPKP